MSIVNPVNQPEPTDEWKESEDYKKDQALWDLVNVFCKAVYHGDYFNEFNVWMAMVDGSLNQVITDRCLSTAIWAKYTENVKWEQKDQDGTMVDDYEETLIKAFITAGGWVYRKDYPSVPMRDDSMAVYHWNVLEEKFLEGKANAVRIKESFGAAFK